MSWVVKEHTNPIRSIKTESGEKVIHPQTLPIEVANLIAAAPDMLAALSELAVVDFGDGGWTEQAEQAAILARKAIAKVKGV